MKEEDLKAGVVYQFHWGRGKGGLSIGTVLQDGCNKLDKYVYKGIRYKTYVGEGDMNFAIENCTPATPEQIQWLNACIKADKFIPFEDINLVKTYELW